MQIAQSIDRYGIHLRPMGAADVEQVRRWRNADHVRSKMEFQTLITPEMQAIWWQGLDPWTQHYFIIVHSGRDIGVIHAKEIDWDARTAETGIFVGDVDYLDSYVPVLAVLALMDALFEEYGLQTLQAKVRADAPKIIDYNLRLGYAAVHEDKGFLRMQVARAAYESASAPLRRMARQLTRS
jgi:RimJ/RimL family protein N-acetyltransferase